VPTFQSLLQAVLDRPDDDLPRQILGDYLLDQPDAGDHARGEFLHVQCRLAHLGDDDPERPDLERRQAQLLPTSPQRWARPFRRRDIKAWTFERGLVDGLTLRPADFDRVADLIVREQPVRRLRLLGGGWVKRLRDWPGLDRIRGLTFEVLSAGEAPQILRSPRLAGLRELTIPSWSSAVDVLQNAACLGSIETLDVNQLRTSANLGVPRSVRLPRLRSLRIRSLEGVGEVLPQLRELGLVRVNLASFNVLARASNLAPFALESLTLDGCFNSSQMPHPDDLLRLPALASLRRFELRDAPLSDVTALAGLLKRSRISRLVLHNAVVTQVRPLALSKGLANLRELAVTRTRSTPISLPGGQIEALAAADLRSLTSLSLCGYDLTLNDVLDLLSAPWLDQLHTLCLRECDLNPHAVSVILGRAWPRLARLDLRGNRLGSENETLLRERFGIQVRY
jgi:uncharacterized protein (TIGR02996 family)